MTLNTVCLAMFQVLIVKGSKGGFADQSRKCSRQWCWIGFYRSLGGYKQSGNGREWGEFGFEEFLELKAVMNSDAA